MNFFSSCQVLVEAFSKMAQHTIQKLIVLVLGLYKISIANSILFTLNSIIYLQATLHIERLDRNNFKEDQTAKEYLSFM